MMPGATRVVFWTADGYTSSRDPIVREVVTVPRVGEIVELEIGEEEPLSGIVERVHWQEEPGTDAGLFAELLLRR